MVATKFVLFGNVQSAQLSMCVMCIDTHSSGNAILINLIKSHMCVCLHVGNANTRSNKFST